VQKGVILNSRKATSSGKRIKGAGKFTLKAMSENAKIIGKTYVDPIIDSLMDDGFIPGQKFDNLMEGIESKYLSFHRKLDNIFESAYGQAYHDFRQKEWKKILKLNIDDSDEGHILRCNTLRGADFAIPKELVLLSDKNPKDGCYTKYAVKLIPGQYRAIEYSDYDYARMSANLIPGKVSQFEDELKYNLTYEHDWHISHKTELEELKYIYRAFWEVSNMSRRNWLGSLLQYHDRFVLDYRTNTYISPDGLRRDRDVVLFCVEGYTIEKTVEELYDWITNYRIPGKKYRIGEAESDIQVLYGMLLVELGADEFHVKRDLTHEMIESELTEIRQTLEPWRFRQKPEEDSDWLPDEWKKPVNLGFEVVPQSEEVKLTEHVSSFNFDSIAEQLAMQDDSDSYDSEEDMRERAALFNDEDELPYPAHLHASSDEYVSLFERNNEQNYGTSEPGDPRDFYETMSNGSENIADQELTALENLGIDLVDNSDRTFIDNPTRRRVELVWMNSGRVHRRSAKLQK
jgi:hypothetical protein